MAEALDALRCAVVLTNEHGTILHANRPAEHMLREGGPIHSAQGILQATAPSAASEPRSAITLAAGNEAGIGKTGLAIRLTEPDVPAIFAHGYNPRPLPPCSSVRRRTRRMVPMPWLPPLV